jgi:hypothetical protein
MAVVEHERYNAPAPRSAFQVRLTLAPVPSTDEDLDDVAELALEALAAEASTLALGPAASIDLDRREVCIELTVEAASASEVSQKMGLILGALERGAPFVIIETNTARSEPEPVVGSPLVCA